MFPSDAYVRVEQVGTRRLVTLTDMERIVSLLMDGKDIVDCLALRRKQWALDSITGEAEDIEQTGKIPDGLEIHDERLDVGWYGRQCRKQLRDVTRAEQLGHAHQGLAKELVERQQLEKGLDGTTFCSRKVPQFSLREEHLGEKKGLDRCCMNLWDCPEYIGIMSYEYRLMNANMFPLFSCKCRDSFLQCLETEEGNGEDGEEAGRLGRMWKSYSGGCVEVKEVKECDEYTAWFDDCVTANNTMVATLRRT